MAKKPIPASNDPAALAFSAVEDALKDSVFNLDEGVEDRTPHPQIRERADRADRQRTTEKIAAQTGAVANDDRFSGTRLLTGLQSKSSPQPTYIAIGLSVIWVIAVILAEVLRLRAQGGDAPLFANSLELVGFLAILVLPIAAFFAIATLVRRAQELRMAASSITQAAIRLAEPETTASEKVASVGQAVRREVNALGDGLERALARAGELEVMIHNEVTALERTYSENESRMRALIQELASQRDSVITNTDKVREAITESHTGLVFDLDMISQRIAGTIVESGGNLTRSLETAGNTLTNTFGERTESFIQLVDNRTGELLSSLDESASRLNLTLEDRAASLSQAFESRTYELSSVIEGRMNALVDAFDSRSATLSEAIDSRTSSLAKLLAEGGSTLLDQLRDRGHEVSGALDLTGARIASDIANRAKEAEVSFAALAKQLDESVAVNLNAMESRLHSAVIEISGNIEETTERARTTLSQAGADTLGHLEGRVQEIASIIDGHIQNLDGMEGRLQGALVDIGRNFDEASERARRSISDAGAQGLSDFDAKIGEIVGTIDTHVQGLENMESRLQGVLVDIGGSLDEAAERARLSLSQAGAQSLADFDAKIEEIVGTIDAQVRGLEGMEGRLQSALADIGNSVDEATERARASIGQAGAQGIADFDAKIEEIVGTIDTHVQGLEGMEGRLQSALVDIGNSLDEAAERARLSLTQAGAQSLAAFDAKIDEIAGTIDNRVQGLENVIGDKGERLVESLDRHAAAFAARANVLESALDEKAGTFSELVDQRTHEMTEALGIRIKQISDTIGNRAGELTDTLEGHANIIADALDNRLQLLNDTMRGRTDEFAAALDTRTEFLNDSLDQRTRALSATLDGRTQELGATLEGRTRELAQSVEARVQEIASTLDTRTELLNDALDQRSRQLTSTLDTRTQQLASAIATRSNELSDALATRTEQLSDTLGQHTMGIANTIGESTVALARTIDQQGQSVRESIDQSLGSVTGIMADRADMLSNLIANRVSDVNENLGRSVESAIQRIVEAEGSVAGRIEAASSTVGDSARHAADIIETGVNSARRAITDMVDQRLGTLPEAITARADITAERLAALNSAINSALVQSMSDLESGADRLEETISKRIVAASANIASDVAQTADHMDVAVRNVLDRLQLAAQGIEEVISVKAVAAAEQVSGRVVEIHRAVSEQTNAFAALVNERSEQLHIALLNHGNVLRDALAEHARGAEEIMAGSTQRILADVTTALDKLNESNSLLQRVLDSATGNLASLESSIADQTASYSATVRDAIGSTEEAGKMVSEHVSALQNTIRGMISEFGTMIGTLDNEARTIDQAAANLNTSSSFAVQTLDERRAAMDTLAQSFAARADDIDARMRGFAQSIADTVNDTERRLLAARQTMEDALGVTSASVANVMSEATQNLSQTLSESTGHVTTALNITEERVARTIAETQARVDENVNANAARVTETLTQTEQRLLETLSTAEERLSRTLAETDGKLESTLSGSEQRFANVFATAEDRLESVLSSAETRVNETLTSTTDRVQTTLELASGNVANLMNTTAGTLSDAINANAENVAEALRQATAEAAARLADIRGTATAEGQKADELLRQTQQAMIAEMQKALEDATRRFNETAASMRSTAKEVSTELEATRTELARGVIELPEETRASAAAMRRVVAEQIEALSELNDIVRSQSATHDLHERRERTAPPPPPRAESRPEPFRQPEPARPAPAADPAPARDTAHVEPRPAPAYQPAAKVETPAPAAQPAQAHPQPALQPASRIEHPATPASTYQPTPRPVEPTPAPQPTPAFQAPPLGNGAPLATPARNDDGGWLRDVLRNASAKQAGAQPQQGNLSGLTDEIARAIDLNALADAWARYQAGEPNVFSRRIYTLTGQGTYDEVRKKLQRDPDFARTAQAYMGEFEQLLRRAAAGPRPAQESREYLLSDRGKVYTMLAHASGRLN